MTTDDISEEGNNNLQLLLMGTHHELIDKFCVLVPIARHEVDEQRLTTGLE